SPAKLVLWLFIPNGCLAIGSLFNASKSACACAIASHFSSSAFTSFVFAFAVSTSPLSIASCASFKSAFLISRYFSLFIFFLLLTLKFLFASALKKQTHSVHLLFLA